MGQPGKPEVSIKPAVVQGGTYETLVYCTAVAFEESDVKINLKRFWEKAGALSLVCRLVGKGLSDREIATKLNLTELSVQTCIVWILHFLGLTNRNELIRDAAPPLVREAAIVDAPLQLRMAVKLSL